MKKVIIVLFLIEFIATGNGLLKNKVKEVSHYREVRAAQPNNPGCHPPCTGGTVCVHSAPPVVYTCFPILGTDPRPCSPGSVWSPSLNECVPVCHPPCGRLELCVSMHDSPNRCEGLGFGPGGVRPPGCNPPCVGPFKFCIDNKCEGGPGPVIPSWLCPPGEVWDAKLNECVALIIPIVPGGVRPPGCDPPCAPFKVCINNECVGGPGPVRLCPPGEVWDPKLQECVPYWLPLITTRRPRIPTTTTTVPVATDYYDYYDYSYGHSNY